MGSIVVIGPQCGTGGCRGEEEGEEEEKERMEEVWQGQGLRHPLESHCKVSRCEV